MIVNNAADQRRPADTSKPSHPQAFDTPLLAAATASARFGLVALLSVGALSAQTPDANKTDPKKDEAQKLEKFEVTGSRIKRLDYETPAPVETFSIAEVEAKG